MVRELIWTRKTRKRVPFRQAPKVAEKRKYTPLVHQCLCVLMEKDLRDVEGQYLRIRFDTFPEILHNIVRRGEGTEYDFRTKILKVQSIILLKYLYELRYSDVNPYLIKDLRKAWSKVSGKQFENSLEINEKSLDFPEETEL